MQFKGLSKLYVESKQVRLSFNQIKCLASVPPNKVIASFKFINSTAVADFGSMFDYFEKYYFGNEKLNSLGIIIIPFPIQVWNCYQRVLSIEGRTNNSLEIWH